MNFKSTDLDKFSALYGVLVVSWLEAVHTLDQSRDYFGSVPPRERSRSLW